ncbi:BMP family ABC transporter substrate-binding protein [Mycoplasmopsis cynos]|uniref:ABC transporter xylose-binding lipoprotein n=3 Tax=Mycoplasmopsis cynos TaxID=171284 RepID=L0RW54_MYCC1|nr:BMP family ABC transporter substrate-binding protein [Mycoplasmopsis cynos]WQQ20096.1 BMP family ABC transporter substrate-binding protein [Mycoplasmopsis cynos]CCP23861.1 ABC transporter xylose-binding lipoprotein [Mycoplasmopsis cynos C142]
MKLKKHLLALAGMSSIILPVIAVSCGNTSNKSAGVNSYIKKAERVSKITLNPQLVENAKTKKLNFTLVTDAGHVTDKSFNQSAWEALLAIYDQVENKKDFSFKSVEPAKNSYQNAYRAAIDEGTNVLILPGFTHIETISDFIKNNKKELEEKNILIIGIDFDLNYKTIPEGYKNFVSLLFDVNQASWQLGYAMAGYFAEKYPNDPEKRSATSFGGAPIPSVTDFISGWLKGIIKYNEENTNKKFKHKGKLSLNAHFEPSQQKTDILNAINADSTVIYPVAGPATGGVLEEYEKNQEKYKDRLIVGVDVNQALAFEASRGKFLTSVEKKIAQSVYDVILGFGFENKEEKAKLQKLDTNKDKTTKKTHSLVGGHADGWVGLSSSTLTNEQDRALMNKHINDAKTKFEGLSEEDKKLISAKKVDKNSSELSVDKLVEELVKKVS